MRFRLTLLIFSLLLTLTTQGQELTIKSMQATNDLSASQHRRVDRNNEPCGLVKVRLATTGATFEGNVIQPVEYKTGEYWVYMTKGSKELHVKHPSFLPIEVHFGDYGLSKGIQALTTYTLILVMPQIAGMDVDDGNRFLAMTVEPKDAMVYIDNQLQRLQDGSLSILLPMGQHQYRVEAPACESKSGSFVIGNETSRLTVRLESTMASLNISSTIQGTQIYINDQLKGTSAWSGSLPPGTYRVEGRLSGYRNYRQSVTLAQHDNKQITIPQLIAMTGALSVNYQPIDAEVWIDGKKAGTSPNVFRNLLVGKHSIKLRANGYTSKQLQTTIEEGKTSTISGSLDKVSVSTSSIDNSLSAEALFDRGCNYLYGTGNKTKDYAKALEYFQVAANRGHSNSQVNLGFMYDQGMGVPQDYSEAAKWYLKAAAQGDEDAKKKLEELNSAAKAPKAIKVIGTILDKKNNPLIGASVRIKGSNIGDVTDYDGNFALQIPTTTGETKLQIKYVGFKTQTITVDKKIYNQILKIVMSE